MSEAPEHNRSNRPTLAVATIGHHHSGKTSLTAKITEVLSRRSHGEVKAVTAREIERLGGLWASRPGDVLGERTIAAGEVYYHTEHRRFVHVDSPGWRPWLKNASRAQGLVDALIVVVSAVDGVQPQTHEHLLLARALGHTQVVVFLNKCDLVREPEWLDLVEQDVREVLIRCGFDGDGTRIIRGAAAPKEDVERWDACIDDLVEALEVDLQFREARVEGPPLLYIDHVYSRRPGVEGFIASGRVGRGTLRKGERVGVVGLDEPRELVVAELEHEHEKVEQAQAGQFVGFRLIRRGAPLGFLERPRTGQALVEPTTPPVRRLTAHLDLLAPSERGRLTPIRSGHVGLLLFGTLVIAGRIEVLGQEAIAPGEGAPVAVELLQPVYLEPGMTFLLRDGNQGTWTQGQPIVWAGTSGMGRVIEVRP